jgi:hypothetical protein
MVEGLAALFAERPGFKGRRVGQVTCALVRYLPDHFPRGQLGAPKDAEVEELLAGTEPEYPWSEVI